MLFQLQKVDMRYGDLVQFHSKVFGVAHLAPTCLSYKNRRIIPALTPNRCKRVQCCSETTEAGSNILEQVGDKCKIMRPRAFRMATKCGRQVGDTCKITRPRAPGVGDKWEARVNSCGPEHPEWKTSVGDKWETSVKSCGPEH